MLQTFRFFDEDGDGTISREELKKCMRKIGEELSDDDLNEMLNEADLNGDGQIDFNGMINFNFLLYFLIPEKEIFKRLNSNLMLQSLCFAIAIKYLS